MEEIALNCAASDGDQSLLLEKLGRGVGVHILPKIFKFVTSIKEKGRLARVCRSFKLPAHSVEAWSSVHVLEIETDWKFDCNKTICRMCRINDEPISAYSFEQAFRFVLSKSRNLQAIYLCQGNFAELSLSESIVDAIMQLNNVVHFRNLRTFHVKGWMVPEVAMHILTLIETFKNQLTDLSFQTNSELTGVLRKLWPIIGRCANLKRITFSSDQDAISAEIVKTALRGKAIEFFDLSIMRMSAHELIEIVSCLADNSLRTLHCTNGWMKARDNLLPIFAQGPRSECWNSLQTVQYTHFGELLWRTVDPFWSIILELPRISPQFKMLDLRFHYATPRHIAELMMAYLEILDQGSDERTVAIHISFVSVERDPPRLLWPPTYHNIRCTIKLRQCSIELLECEHACNATCLRPGGGDDEVRFFVMEFWGEVQKFKE